MITSVLVDLDGTLLDNAMETFVPAYTRLLGERLAALVSPEALSRCLRAGTAAMIRNMHPARTLKDVFDEVFYPGVGVSPEALQPLVEQFYREDFPRLRTLTRPRPAARPLIEWAFAHGLEIVIATNPLFPRTAIEQRLEWAGVPASEFRYALVASMETFHYSKPHPEFLAEILARVNRHPANALLIGDLWENDIRPAAAMGMNTFWIDPDRPAADGIQPGGAGSLDDLLARMESVARASPPLSPTPTTALAPILAGNLSAALHALRDVPLAAWHRRPARTEWSLVEIVCHLRDVEREIHLPRLELILGESNPFLPIVDSDVWAEPRQYIGQDPVRALEDYITARKEHVAGLRRLNEAAWTRTARHGLFGPTTLAEITAVVSDHDRLHLEQIRATVERLEIRG